MRNRQQGRKNKDCGFTAWQAKQLDNKQAACSWACRQSQVVIRRARQACMRQISTYISSVGRQKADIHACLGLSIQISI